MNLIDLDDLLGVPADITRTSELDRRFGPCEDDFETTCPYVGMLPEESEKEDGSPLRF